MTSKADRGGHGSSSSRRSLVGKDWQEPKPQPESGGSKPHANLTGNDALAVHEIDAVAGHVGHGNPQQLPVGQRVHTPDVLLGAGGEELGGAAAEEKSPGE